MFNRFRNKKNILLEFINDFNPLDEVKINDKEYPALLSENNLYMQNRFSVHLEGENIKISPDKIKGFKLLEYNNKKNLLIKSTLYINDWIDDFKQIDFAKIYFFDKNGNILRFFDLDLGYVGYKLECDYKTNDFLTPVFDYEIF
jgi:hypothetical protein